MIRSTYKKTYEVAQDYYKKFIVNLEEAKAAGTSMSPEIKSRVHAIGLFLRSRSSEFEVLENQEDISVFLSLCKSNEENLILVFNYFLSDSPVMENKKESPSEYLKTLLNNFDKAIESIKKMELQNKPPSEFKVSSRRHRLDSSASGKKMSGPSFR